MIKITKKTIIILLIIFIIIMILPVYLYYIYTTYSGSSSNYLNIMGVSYVITLCIIISYFKKGWRNREAEYYVKSLEEGEKVGEYCWKIQNKWIEEMYKEGLVLDEELRRKILKKEEIKKNVWWIVYRYKFIIIFIMCVIILRVGAIIKEIALKILVTSAAVPNSLLEIIFHFFKKIKEWELSLENKLRGVGVKIIRITVELMEVPLRSNWLIIMCRIPLSLESIIGVPSAFAGINIEIASQLMSGI